MDRKDPAERARELRERYGELLTLEDLATVLRYPSLAAIRQARRRRQLPLPLVQLPPRRAWFTTPEAVAQLLNSLDQGKVTEATRKEEKNSNPEQ